ncbi:hypothetical protein BC826DRAFT_974461 [Russula brevipes]|nr:hypothetical protein BC826DRAFT_974461 [Russula brevipes]
MHPHVSSHLVSHPGRFHLAVNELNYHSAHLTHGVSKDKARSTFQDSDKPSGLQVFDNEYISADAKTSDLIANLITDEKEIWGKLLANAFCTKMKMAKKGELDSALKTYMTTLQDSTRLTTRN